jgi:hypothetical protein
VGRVFRFPREIASPACFAVEVDTFARDLGPEIIQKYSLGRELDVWHCTKPAAGPLATPGVSLSAN